MLLLFMPLMLLQAVVFLLPTFLPKDTVKAILEQLDFSMIMLIFLFVLLIANVGLLWAATKRFRRSMLLLS